MASVKKVRPGVYLVRVSLGFDDAGKRLMHSKTVHGTLEEAREYATDVQSRVDRGLWTAKDQAPTLREQVDHYIRTVSTSRCRPYVTEWYKVAAKYWITEPLASTRIDKLTTPMIREFCANMLTRQKMRGSDTYSPSTVAKVKAVLHAALEDAVVTGLIARNPSDHCPVQKAARRTPILLTMEKVQLFVAECRRSMYGIVHLFGLATGMRPSEYLGLRWSDIDMERRIVRLSRVMITPRIGRPFISETKTPWSRRTIELPQSLMGDLVAHKQRQAQQRQDAGPLWAGTEDLVFCQPDGLPINTQWLNRISFRKIASAIELPLGVRQYDLRHAYSTMLLADGAGLKTVSNNLGHSSITITGNVYAHVTDEMRSDSAVRTDRLLFGGDSSNQNGST